MAILKMKRIEVIALQSDAKSIVEFLQRSGTVEISQRPGSTRPAYAGTAEDSSLVQLHTHVNITQFDKTLHMVNSALAVLHEYVPAKKSLFASFTGRRELSLTEFSARSHKAEETLRKANEIIALSRRIEAAHVVITHTRSQLEAMLPWQDLDIPMQFSGTDHTSAIVGSLPALYTEESLLAALMESFGIESGGTDALLREVDDMAGVGQLAHPLIFSEERADEFPPVFISVISSSREITCVVVICHKDDEPLVRRTLRRVGLSIHSDPTKHPPAVRIARFRARIAEAQAEIADASAQLAGHKHERDSLEFLSDYYLMRRDKYEALGQLRFSRKTFVLEGFIPQKNTKHLEEVMNRHFNVSVTFEDPSEDENIPVLLQNNPLVSPVEDIVESYSLPSRTDLDPNPAMAFFYYLFFGMMLSDAGYGVIIVAATLAILRFLKPEGNMKRNIQKFFLCGLSTVFWGALFGSWFGNIVYVVSTTFLGKNISLAPLWFDPVTDPLKLLILSLILGFIHIMVGLALRFYNMCRHGEWLDALFDIGLWWVVFAGLGVVVGSMALTVTFPLQTIGLWIAAAGGLGLVLTQGRSNKSIIAKLFGGIASLYSITGYFSDILSYSRLMALGLVTGIIGTVVNTIGSIGGGGIGGAVIFIIIFIAGHSINIGINALGAYVHVNRLQYVEFFSKFYEGGGKAFKPFGIKTKSYKFKEDK